MLDEGERTLYAELLAVALDQPAEAELDSTLRRTAVEELSDSRLDLGLDYDLDCARTDEQLASVGLSPICDF